MSIVKLLQRKLEETNDFKTKIVEQVDKLNDIISKLYNEI